MNFLTSFFFNNEGTVKRRRNLPAERFGGKNGFRRCGCDVFGDLFCISVFNRYRKRARDKQIRTSDMDGTLLQIGCHKTPRRRCCLNPRSWTTLCENKI